MKVTPEQQERARQLNDGIAALMERASQDEAFRARALKEPVASLNEVANLNLPLNTPIRFVEKPEELVVVLPAFGSDPNEILDEEMLGKVSGGLTPIGFVIGGVVAVALITTAIVDADMKTRK